MATRVQPGTQKLTVRDVSSFGMGLTAPQALPVTLGERVYVLIDWDGSPAIRGSLLRARVRRRRPDRDGWFVGIEIDDLRQTPWKQLAEWIEREAARTPVPAVPAL